MRRIAYGLMGLGVIVAALGLIVLTWGDNLDKPFGNHDRISVALLLVGAVITYVGVLVRRRSIVTKERERAA